MAVVGHAEILVKALTRGVEEDIKRAFSGAAKSVEEVGTDMGKGLSRGMNRGLGTVKIDTLESQLVDALKNSVNLAEAFTSLARKSYFVQGALGALGGSLAAVVGGLGALVGVAGGAASALVAVGSAGIQAMIGMKVLKLAFGGIGQAVSAATKANKAYGASLKKNKFDAEEAALTESRAALNLEKAREALLRTQDLSGNSVARREAVLNYQEAELALRKAKSAEKDAAAASAGGAAAGGADPYAGLTKSQAKFAKYLVSIKPKLNELKEAVASGFLPLLETQMRRLMDSELFGILKKRFNEIGVGGGKAVEAFTNMLLSERNLKSIDSLLRQVAETLPKFGGSLSNLFEGFLTIVKAAEPLTDRFVAFLEKKSGAFSKFLSTKESTGELTRFFNTAGDLAARFGKVFGNWFKDIGDIIAANFGPGSGGDTLLTWLNDISKSRFNMDALKIYFKGAADNFIAMADALGHAITIIIKAGSSPEIAKFWNTMDTAAYAFNELFTEAIKVGPAFGKVLASLVKIFSLIADNQQATNFFETLNFVLQGVYSTLKSIKPLLDFGGSILGYVSAVGLAIAGILKFTGILSGFALKLLSTTGLLKLMPAAFVEVGTAATAAGTATTVSFGAAAVAVGALVAILAGTAIVVNGIKQANIDKTADAITAAINRSASATEIWNASLITLNTGGLDSAIGSSKKVKLALDEYANGLNMIEGKSGTESEFSRRTTAMNRALDGFDTSLSNLATTNLPKAQEAFKKYGESQNLNRKQMVTSIMYMGDFKKALISQADAQGYNVRKTDGSIDRIKLYNFAIGGQKTATDLAREAQERLNASLQANMDKFIDYDGPLTQNKDAVMKWAKHQADITDSAKDSWEDYWDGQSFSMGKYLDDLKKQAADALKYQMGIETLAQALPQEVLEHLTSMQDGGAKLVAALTDGVNDPKERKKYVEAVLALIQAGKTAVENKFDTKYSSSYIPGVTGVKTPKKKDGGLIGNAIKKFAPGGFVSGLGTARSDSIPAMLSNGEYVVNARATAQNRDLLEAINNNKAVKTGSNVNIIINPSEKMDERALAALVSRRIAFEIRKGTI